MFSSLLVLVVFWSGVIRQWIMYGIAVPLLFVALWFGGLYIIPKLGFEGYSFLAFEVVLTVSLLLYDRYKAYTSRSLF